MKRGLNRYETCVVNIQQFMAFPIDVMFQLKYEERFDKVAFKDFMQKALLLTQESLVEMSVQWNASMTDEIRSNMMETPIFIGYPNELTSSQFLNNLYQNLNLTGIEGIYKMSQELEKFSVQTEFSSMNQENITKEAKEIFESCGSLLLNCHESKDFTGLLIN